MPLFQNHCTTFIGISAPFNQNLHAIEYDIEDHVSLLQAIMMQESGGKGNDPMQASESGYNTKFPRVPNGITEPEYSIDVSTHTFSDCVKKANVKDLSDTEHIYLALQGYDYESGYIDWTISEYSTHSEPHRPALRATYSII